MRWRESGLQPWEGLVLLGDVLPWRCVGSQVGLASSLVPTAIEARLLQRLGCVVPLVPCQPSVSSGTTGFTELLPSTGSSHLSPGGTCASSWGTSRLTMASSTFSIRKARALAISITNLCASSLRRDVHQRTPSTKGTVLAWLTACPSR